MAHGDKSAYYQALKKAGYSFDRHYRDYTTDELAELWEEVKAEQDIEEDVELPTSPYPEPQPEEPEQLKELQDKFDRLTELVGNLAEMVMAKPEKAPEPEPKKDSFATDSEEHAGLSQNAPTSDGVIKVDEDGNEWYQIEVAKASYPKPRGRRVLRTTGGATKQESIKVGEFTESFEVLDDSREKPLEIRITLPSHQTGIYKAPNMPFRIHTYRGARGFNLFDVQNFYGGADLVPATIKRVYVSHDLCYDITTTIRAIENEYRERVLRAEKGIEA